MTVSLPSPTPHGYFRRWIEGSDISLEANTEAVPEAGHLSNLENPTVFNTAVMDFITL